MDHLVAIIVATAVGCGYYAMMEQSIPTESNCSFSASPMTDFLAFVWGALIAYYGFAYNNPILTFLGTSIIVEHIFQFMRKD